MLSINLFLIDSVFQCISARFTQARALGNPESYVLFSLAMWYRAQGWDFSSGKAVRIED